LTGRGRPRRGTDPRRRACGSCAAARRPPRPGAASSGIWRKARRRPRPRRSLPTPRGAPRGRLRGPPEGPRAPGRAASLWCLRSHEARRCGRRAQRAGPPKPRAKGICRLSRRMRGRERAGVLARGRAGCTCVATVLSSATHSRAGSACRPACSTSDLLGTCSCAPARWAPWACSGLGIIRDGQSRESPALCVRMRGTRKRDALQSASTATLPGSYKADNGAQRSHSNDA